ncbi:TetR/AcrR family transcriptional regulator [Rhodococcus sp. D2-41]|uniref:TetR family transcriptional regulator n=1 Tax=Speluncibacter jeojiensis TaxID=2710754 RepID=A0A9X4LXR9_9ACTN|nr:TetR/AcrR family transcriptional regulator [Rhodococcus sp. D2-41]MDG3008636.1 TetR/AcrR family transcriptional regulator [Rhodococcus sp. D2-41]MDG3013157.1 TetR family transcriptional regulator [Corynebacteriales bacterium D3-21]
MEAAEEPLELVPRRRPIQDRSKRRFDTLLTASRELLVDVGFESFTCEEVATRAEVPIGTLYQFFANKYVIVCELDRQDLVAVQQELSDFGGEIPSLDWLRFLDRFVDHLAQLWLTDPSRRAVWLAVQATPATRATAAIHERALAQQVARALAPLIPRNRRHLRTIMADVLVHMVYSMLNFSVQDGQSHTEVVVELKRMMRAYLIFAAQDGDAEPDDDPDPS